MTDSPAPRREFLARIAAGTAVLGAAPALALGCATPADSKAETPSGDELDTWLGGMKATYKVIYDGVQASGGPDAIIFARNFYKFSQDKLGTKDADMAVIVSFRHFATPYGFTDVIWSKYPQIATMLKINDPKTGKPAVRNAPLHDDVEGQAGANIPALVARGAQITVCGAATEFVAKLLAGEKGDAKAIEAELAANLVPNARIVPAGVVVVQRAQKAGFAYTFAG
jgi:hypothetical protein